MLRLIAVCSLSLLFAACAAPAKTAGPIATAVPAARSEAPLVGNGVSVPLPPDAPAVVRGLPALRSCGAEVLFEADVDVSPVPTAPASVTSKASNQQALDCLMAAWQSHRVASVTTSETSDEGDEIFTIYRLAAEGTLVTLNRVWAHADRIVTWTRNVCRELRIDSGRIVPDGCATETTLH